MSKKTYGFRLESYTNDYLQGLADIYSQGNKTEMLERMIDAFQFICRVDHSAMSEAGRNECDRVRDFLEIWIKK